MKTDAGEMELLRETVADNNGWLDTDLDIPRDADGSSTLILEAWSEAPGQIALWSNPVLYDPRPAEPRGETDQRTAPNILLYVVDSLRADHLECYGYHRATAPHVAAMAGRGVRFRRCLTTETCTKPSMLSLAASVDMLAHGVNCYGPDAPPSLVMFPERLRWAGYVTGCVTENLYTPPDTPGRRVYSYVQDLDELTAARVGSTFAEASHFLEMHSNRPFFLYVHTMECHVHLYDDAYSYDAPPPFEGRWTNDQFDHINRYDETILFADANFQRLLMKLQQLGLDKRTLVIFTSDHGEGFGKHDGRIIHCYEPYDELSGVPLVMSWPGVLPEGCVVEPNVSLIDLAPTFLDLAGLPPCDQFQGMSLWPLVRGEQTTAFQTRPVFSFEGRYDAPLITTGAAIIEDLKAFGLVWTEQKQLFDLAADPDEFEDVASAHPEVTAQLSDALEAHWRAQAAMRAELGGTREAGATVVDPARDEALRALGYLDE
ncbi:MAG TPA: hypothetical protein ENN80_02385 [Candidatus Hydrogenedentes bacterium]|nr:hypothetical protein [Candidatus Hydrogenedentota bacterium]